MTDVESRKLDSVVKKREKKGLGAWGLKGKIKGQRIRR
jgi:hypothetical protein